MPAQIASLAALRTRKIIIYLRVNLDRNIVISIAC